MGLKQVREMSQCNIKLGQEPDSQGNRRCDVSGPTVEHIASAVHAIASRVFEPGDSVQCKLFVAFPNEYVGQVIGKGAENLKRIRDMTGANLQLMKDVMSDQGDRVGQLVGVQNQLGAAIRIALGPVGSASAGNMPAAQQRSTPYYSGGLGQQPMQPQHMPMQAMQGTSPPMSMLPLQAPTALTGVKRGSGDANEMQVHMVISPKYVGAILGKEGAQIKQITTDTGCANVSVTRRDPGNPGDRRVVVLGGFDECANAQRAVYQLALTAAQGAGEEVKDLTIIFMVPQHAAGAVIGKEGAHLKQLRDQLGLRVTLSREVVEGFRPCNLVGPLESILMAEKQIQEQVLLHPQPAAGEDRSNGAKRFAEEGEAPAVPGAFTEMKRPRMMAQPAPGEGTTKLLVPSASAGSIIGKQGSVLKQIRESCGASLEILPQVQTPHLLTERLVTIRGPAACREAALARVMQAAFDKDQLNTMLKLLVPGPMVGAVIGRQGSTLKAIRDQCGLGVQVEREEIHGDRLVSATGAMGSVLAATSLILQAIEAAGAGKQVAPMGQPQMGAVPTQATPQGAYWMQMQQGME
ncbi:IGF2BP2 [Symbiodinium natans]|uniref:IGF2BP2 protein n=1 Tax=Symbiodinium natans TaxID=878477 RepID=A0A812P680_9DINO|nr:IGF2BP2 [Symbiodinium natans]